MGRRLAALTVALAGAALSGCGGGEAAPQVPGSGPVDTGDSFFFTEPNFSGNATSVRLNGVQFGRLVQLFGLDDEDRRVPMGDNFIISQGLRSDSLNYELEFNPVTGQETLTILRDVTDEAGRAQFIALAGEAGGDLDTIQVQDLGAPLLSMMPRNAAIVLRFDDLLAPQSITDRTVQIVTGLPPSLPFEGRVLPSQFYGGVGNDGNFYPTRVVVDLTISEIEAFASPVPLIVNAIGLPPSLVVGSSNAQLRIPTRTYPAVGITQVLTNLSGSPLAQVGNGPSDLGAVTRPITRAFRSGGRADLISDPFNGFLRDEQRPVVVGSTPLEVTERPSQIGGPQSRRFNLPRIAFGSTTCSSPPEAGDVIQQPGVILVVEADGNPPINGETTNVLVQLAVFPSTWAGPGDFEIFGLGPATYDTAFDPITDQFRSECFVSISPQPEGFPELPSTGLSTGSILSFRFSEPMDPLSLTAFDSVTLTREPLPTTGNLPTSDYIVGRVSQTADLLGVTFIPDQPLAHEEGATEDYFLTLADETSAFPPRDLAGNVVQTLPEIPTLIDADEATQRNGGRVSRFTSIDEEPPFDKPEWGGQLLVDPLRQLIRPRPVIRSQVVIDENQAIVRQMTQFPPGVVTPFSTFGSKMQTLWRYADCGFSLTDSQNINIDIESLNWAPVGGVVTPDAFSEFEIRLAHSRFAPDEIIDPASLFPRFQNSGLRPGFEENLLPGPPQVTVHPRQSGYVVDGAELFQTTAGTTLIPFPLNRNIPADEFVYYTWRDTSIRERTGQQTSGVDPESYLLALGIGLPAQPYYRPNEIQTIGLPLLMEFRTFPDENAVGLNGWVLNLAVNSSSRPYFRAFSTGGVNQGGANVFIDPETQASANGGFSPGTTPPGGITFGRDNTLHTGAIDYVTRISQVHSLWFESPIEGEAAFTTRRYNPPTLEPALADRPPGTDIGLNYRGAFEIEFLGNDPTANPPQPSPGYLLDNDQDDNGIVDYTEDAFTLDLYGDFYNEVDAPSPNHDSNAMNLGLNFLPAEVLDDWRETVADIADARFYQVRVTFRSNAATNQSPELS
ncbi:MAG: Ig-like domain-containing protein, partial [Planctomycetota bacterium]